MPVMIVITSHFPSEKVIVPLVIERCKEEGRGQEPVRVLETGWKLIRRQYFGRGVKNPWKDLLAMFVFSAKNFLSLVSLFYFSIFDCRKCLMKRMNS